METIQDIIDDMRVNPESYIEASYDMVDDLANRLQLALSAMNVQTANAR